jgi:hypothetical protein
VIKLTTKALIDHLSLKSQTDFEPRIDFPWDVARAEALLLRHSGAYRQIPPDPRAEKERFMSRRHR